MLNQFFHGPAPRSPLRRLSVRLRRSRSNTSIEYGIRIMRANGKRGARCGGVNGDFPAQDSAC